MIIALIVLLVIYGVINFIIFFKAIGDMVDSREFFNPIAENLSLMVTWPFILIIKVFKFLWIHIRDAVKDKVC